MFAIRIRNLRSLVDTGSVNIKPLTLLVGRNNSGKSTFLRAFPLIRQSSETQKTLPIIWYGRYVDFGSFADAVNVNSREQEITFEITIPYQKSKSPFPWNALNFLEDCSLTASITMGPANGLQDSRICSYRIGFGDTDIIEITLGQECIVEKLRVNNTEIPAANKSLLLRDQGHMLPLFVPDEPKIPFLGRRWPRQVDPAFIKELTAALIPFFHGNTKAETIRAIALSLPLGHLDSFVEHLRTAYKREPAKTAMNRLASNKDWVRKVRDMVLASAFPLLTQVIDDAIATFAASIRYIGPLRATAERYYRAQNLAVQEIDYRGENLAMFLRSLRADDKENFGEFCDKYLGFRPELQAGTPQGAVVVREGPEGRFINLADLGFGYSQILPVAAQVWIATRPHLRQMRATTAGTVVAIEQPELHLHPAYQAAIADLFAGVILETKANGRRLNIIAETHSESLINRVGELITTGDLAKEDVQILVFESTEVPQVSKVSTAIFDGNGALQNWPFGFFAGYGH